MGSLKLGFRQIYGGIKTIFGREAKTAAKATANKAPVYKGPSMSDIVRQQPLALPAPSAEQLAADIPQVVVPKVLGGRNLDELRMTQEILADGTHVRYFRGPESNKILIKMHDKGKLHQEWINKENGRLYIKSTGDGSRYVVNKDGNFIQIEQRAVKYKDGMDQTISTNDLYYSDHNGTGLHFHKGNGFNGEQTTYGELIGTVQGSGWKENQSVPVEFKFGAKIKGPYSNRNSRVNYEESPSANIPSIREMYERQGDRIATTACTKAEDLSKIASEKYIHDIDEAFFNPYKA